MDQIKKTLLKEIANLESVPQGAFNIRVNGKSEKRNSTKDISIISHREKDGIEIRVKDGVKNQSVHIPVILSQAGLKEVVFNDFYIGDNCDILIVAGCGIHNPDKEASEHNGIHSFHIGKNSKVRYVEKHLGVGESGSKILNPITNVEMDENSYMEMETAQLGGVTSSDRDTNAILQNNAKLVIKEKILTTDTQTTKTKFNVTLNGENSSTEVISRSVAKGNSYQEFKSTVIGENKSFGHVECDAILMDQAKIVSTPEIVANSIDATLVHEAAIGKIAGEQLIKLMTLGLSENEAEDMIIKGFLS